MQSRENDRSFYTQEELESLGFANLGQNVQISRFASFYGKSNLTIHSNTRVDDFALISTGAPSQIGSGVHIGPYSLIISSEGFDIGNHVTLSSRVSVYGQSDDFRGGFETNPMHEPENRNVNTRRIVIPDHVSLGTGCVVLPSGMLEEGVSVGAMSLLKETTVPWGIYIGIPAKFHRQRKLITDS